MNRSIKAKYFTLSFWLVPILILSIRSFSVSQLSMDVTNAPVTTLAVGDLDFKTFSSTNWFFTLTIHDPGNHPNMQLSGEVNVVLADRTPITNPAASLVTAPFAVNDQRTVSNLDLGKGSDIKTQDFTYDSDAKEKIRKRALATGKLPAGIYTFHLVVTDLDNPNQSASKDIVFNLENISRMDLILPQDGAHIPTPLPFFQWRYDGTDVKLSVYEKRANQQSREEAASGVPYLEVQTGSAGFPSGAKAFQYPSAGGTVRPLESGKTYVWKVIGLSSGTGGVGQEIPSELWEFTVSDHGDRSNDEHRNLRDNLSFLTGLGQDILNELLNGDLTPTGLMYVDGQLVSTADVQAIMNDLKANPDKIVEIQIIQ